MTLVSYAITKALYRGHVTSIATASMIHDHIHEEFLCTMGSNSCVYRRTVKECSGPSS
jgi:hypothetical protein